jgi:ATP-dependent Clp protease ATP-binding subunit ClpA
MLYGARPSKRLIQKELETRLGRLILNGQQKDGETVLAEYSFRCFSTMEVKYGYRSAKSRIV